MRTTGETQFMIDSLVDEVIIGSPMNIVFGHSLNFIRSQLYPRVKEALENKGLKVELVSHMRMVCDHSVIMFMSTQEPIHMIRGLRGSHFVDHNAVDKYYLTFMEEPI